MKRAARNGNRADIAPEYDFRKGVRGKYARKYAEGSNVVVLDPDVAEVFPDASAVNDTLRTVARLMRKGVKRTRR